MGGETIERNENRKQQRVFAASGRYSENAPAKPPANRTDAGITRT